MFLSIAGQTSFVSLQYHKGCTFISLPVLTVLIMLSNFLLIFIRQIYFQIFLSPVIFTLFFLCPEEAIKKMEKKEKAEIFFFKKNGG